LFLLLHSRFNHCYCICIILLITFLNLLTFYFLDIHLYICLIQIYKSLFGFWMS